jgi:hypothetical protein
MHAYCTDKFASFFKEITNRIVRVYFDTLMNMMGSVDTRNRLGVF